MERQEAVNTDRAPRAIGPYSQAVLAGNWVFVSGQLGLNPQTGQLVPGGVIAETRQALANLEAILQSAGVELSDVVRTTLYLVNLEDFAAVNEVYGSVFRPPYPARVTVGVASLPRGGRIEIDAVAWRRV